MIVKRTQDWLLPSYRPTTVPVTPVQPPWQQGSNWSAAWDPGSNLNTLGPKNGLGDSTSIQTFYDITGNGQNFINTDQPMPQNVPRLRTVNGSPAAWYSNADQDNLIRDTSNPPYGYQVIFGPTSGYFIAAVQPISFPTDNANALLDVNLFGDTAGYLQIGFRATGPSLVATITDANGYEEVQSALGSGAGHTKVVEVWWDGVNIYCRVNGGSTVSHACVSVSAFGTATQYLTGAGYDVYEGVDPHGWLDAYVFGMAVRKSIPSNALAVVSSMMTQYGAT